MTDHATAAAPDLRRHPPRRWNVTVDGVIWLPRMIDKARSMPSCCVPHASTTRSF